MNTAATATTVAIDQTTTIDASAIQNGNGGNVVVWSDQLTTVAGMLNARGGALGGNGGFVETSGGAVNFAGIRVDTSGTLGKAGMWLVDPTNLTVDATAAATIVSNLANTNVTLQTNADGTTSGPGTQSSGAGDIIVNSSMSWASNHTLTLNAFHDINLNSAISTASGGLTLNAGNAITATAAVNVGTFTLQGGTWTQVASNLPAFSANDFRLNGGTFIRALGGDGTETPYQIADVYGLQGIGSAGMLGNSYVLANNIDAGGTANWNGGAGFAPIGTLANPFTGTLRGGDTSGNGTAISNLTINASGAGAVGLFGVIGRSNSDCGECSLGSVGNVNLVNASVTASGASAVGAVAGINYGTIWQSSVSGTVSRTGEGSAAVGGLAGENFGSVVTSSSGAAVTGGNLASVGGLVGYNQANGSIWSSLSTGSVIAGTDSAVGGLTGTNAGSIRDTYAIGSVTGGSDSAIGGLVGLLVGSSSCVECTSQSGGSIATSWASGPVSAAANSSNVAIGGLVGRAENGSSVTHSYWDIATTAQASSAGGTGLKTLFARAKEKYSGFDFTNTWFMIDDLTRPILRSEWSQTVTNAHQLQLIAMDPNASYVIGNNINLGPALGNPSDLWGPSGFAPIGSFSGSLDGLGNTIDGLRIISSERYVGLFGQIGINGGVSDLNLTNVSLTANGKSQFVGGVAGNNRGTITKVSVSGNVEGGAIVGGMAGRNGGTIMQSYSMADVSGGKGAFVGGLVGLNDKPGSIKNAHATGAVSGGNASVLGGLVGMNIGAIDPSYATGTVSTTGTGVLGGLVGINVGSINQSAAVGAVTGGPDSIVGGLVGINTTLADPSPGTINQSFAGGAATGGANSTVGGLVGQNGGSITQTYAVGPVTTGTGGVSGGLVAQDTVTAQAPPHYTFNPGPGTVSNSYYDTQTTGQQNSAGGQGLTTAQLANGLPGGFTNPYFAPGSFFPTLPGLPEIPALISSLGTGGLTPPNNPGPGGDFGTQQIVGFILPPNTDSNSLDFTPINLGGPTGPSGGRGGAGGSGGNGDTTGSLANGGQGGNGAPPGTRLIDMPIIPLPPGSGMPPPGETHFSTEHVVFQVGNGVSPQQVAEIAAQFGLTVESSQPIEMLGRAIYTFNTNGKPVRDVIYEFESSSIGGFMQPRYGFTLTQDPADPDAGVGDPSQYVIAKFHLPESHRITRGDNVTIAVIDSEIDANHPDLAGVVENRFDAGCGNTAPDAHGTGMTGAIASHQHLLGVAPNAKIIAICAFGGDASGESTSIKIIKGLDYAIAQGARIVNMSFAGPRDPTLAQALQIAREKGVLLIAAAGNAGPKSPPLYPGADPNVMAVTATDDRDHLFKGANQGKYITVAAPGVDVLVPAPNDGIQVTTGTSVATAHVTGVAALLLAQKPTRTPEEIRAILVQTAKHLGPKGSETQFGAGLVDPLKALRLVPPRVSQNSTATTASVR